jgi:hypothetical protein
MNRTIMTSFAGLCALPLHIVEIFRMILIFNIRLHYMKRYTAWMYIIQYHLMPSLKLNVYGIGNESP